MSKLYKEMIDIAKTQYAHEKQVSVKEIGRELQDELADEASKFANQGQEETIDAYDPSDVDEPDNFNESEKVLEEPDEDHLEILEKLFLKTKNKSGRYSQLRIWANFLKKIQLSALELYSVIEFMLIIPNGTADVERFFKVLKEMKSKRRNRMSASKLRKLLKIFFFIEKNPDRDLLYRMFVDEYKKI